MKKILFICPSFFKYELEICKELSLNYEVEYCDERPKNSILFKILLRLKFRSLIKKAIEQYYTNLLNDINGKHFDYVFVINPEALDYNTMSKLKQECLGVNKQCHFVLYLWDSLKNKPNAPKLFPLFDKVSTFDRKDSDDFNINLIPLFYTRTFDAKYYPVQPLKYDVCFIGTAHSNRLKYLDEILRLISKDKQISKYIFLFFHSRLLFLIKKLFCKSNNKYRINFESLPTVKVVDAIISSAVVIDIHHPSQHGLTMRTIEAVGLNKKIITTNAEIKKYDFYDPKNVYVYQSGDSKLPDEFLSTSTTHFKNREMYSLKCWVEKNLKK